MSRPPAGDLDTLELREAGLIGAAQTLALFAGISRSGITMVGGLLRGLDHEDAARFSFLLATPIIFAAGSTRSPTCSAPSATASGARCWSAASPRRRGHVAVRFLERYFERRTLTPFAIYCLVVGVLSLARLAL